MLAIRIKHNPDIKKNLLRVTTKVNELVITKGYRVWATTIDGQNAFAPLLCFAQVSSDSQNTHDQIMSDRSSNMHDEIAFCALLHS